jgi:hypothetical protein
MLNFPPLRGGQKLPTRNRVFTYDKKRRQHMLYALIGYVAGILGFIVYEIIKVARFIRYQKAMNATLVLDRFMACILWVVAIMLMLLFAVSFAETFSSIDRYIADPSLPLPFPVYVVSLTIILYRISLSEGLYAYTEEVLISYGNDSIPFADLTILKANPYWPHVMKAVVKSVTNNTHARKITIRTNNTANFQRLQSLINAENA